MKNHAMEQVITEIVTGKGSKKRQLMVNDSLYCMLYFSEIRALALEEGQEFTCEVQEQIEEVLRPRARRRTLNLLVAKDRSKRELQEKLKKDGYTEAAIEDAIEFAEGYHYIDDLRFAMKQVRSLQEEKSSLQIRMKLQEKGISRDIIEEAFVAVQEEREEELGEEYEPAELTAIRKLVQRKVPKEGLMPEEQSRKLAASLYQKGFDGNLIRRVLKAIEEIS